jgi:aminopeptidase-like protein
VQVAAHRRWVDFIGNGQDIRQLSKRLVQTPVPGLFRSRSRLL